MHFLVFGATGAIGNIFCEYALEEKHTLTVFVRSQAKLPTEVANSERVTIIEGSLEDEETLGKVSRCGADAFISFAGPPYGVKGTPLTDGYKNLIPKLVSQGTRRVLILCTPSFKGPGDVVSFKWRVGEWTMKVFPSTRGQFEEMISVGGYITSLPVEETKWTLFRVGGLANGELRPVETTLLGSGRDGMWITRASVARWVMDEAIQDKWVGGMPYICN